MKEEIVCIAHKKDNRVKRSHSDNRDQPTSKPHSKKYFQYTKKDRARLKGNLPGLILSTFQE